MNFNDYVGNLVVGTLGGLVSGVFLVVYIDLIPQTSSVIMSLFCAFFVALIPFLFFVLIGKFFFWGNKIDLFKKNKKTI